MSNLKETSFFCWRSHRYDHELLQFVWSQYRKSPHFSLKEVTSLSNLKVVGALGQFMFCYLYLFIFTHTGVQHDFHIKWCSCHLTVIWWMLHVEQKQLTLPEHLSYTLSIVDVCVAWSLVFCVMFWRSLFVLFPFGHCNFCPLITLLAFVISVLWFTTFDYSFGHCNVCPLIYSFWLPFWPL